MTRGIRGGWFGSLPFTFVVEGTPEEAVHRLAAALPRVLNDYPEDEIAGQATVEQVVLVRSRGRSFTSSAQPPEFRGRFCLEGGRTVLRGYFQPLLSKDIGLAIWLTGLFGTTLWAVIGQFVNAPTGETSRVALVVGAVFFASFAFLLASFAVAFHQPDSIGARDDVAAIRRFLHETLAPEQLPASAPGEHPEP